jgi:hypothetical protein
VFSVAFFSIEAIFVTLTTSRSSARPQAVSTGARAVAAGQPEQPVDLPHLHPRQVGVQQPLGIDADDIPVAAGSVTYSPAFEIAAESVPTRAEGMPG